VNRADLITVMTDDETTTLLAFISGWKPEVFDEALADICTRSGGTLAAELACRLTSKADARV
jgi:hypothetical protein